MRLLALLLCLGACQAAATPHTTTAATQHSALPQEPAAADAEEIGSLRHARVAIARGPGAPPLTYFASGLNDAERQGLEELAPGIRFVVGLTQEQALARAAEAHAADSRYASPEFLRRAENLVWIQAHSAGVERYTSIPELLENDRIVLTNMRAVHGPAIAEHAFAMLLALTRDLPVHLADRAQGRWRRQGSGELAPIVLEGRTMLVVGLGGIGGEIARRAHGFGMRVLATRRSDDPAPAYVERLGKPQDLHALLAEADVVAIAVPLTAETEHMFDAAALAAMKPGSYLINVARGRIVDTDALLAALQSGRLAGACLDVTDPEPLPADHPLWRLPNVVITPHVAAAGELTDERAWTLFRENLRRFDAGEPLLNVVDKRAGY
ncbi:MAG: D-2-hydroxyacid dehydrogenase [Planctomycetota bacterium]|nr:MAG: D-2-hydroxyacid dehydrogenase [Planctomycetota bacterium]